MDKEQRIKVKVKNTAHPVGEHLLSACDISKMAAKRIEHDIIAFSKRMDEKLATMVRPMVARHPRLADPKPEDAGRWEEIAVLDQERTSVLRAMYARLYEITNPQPILIKNLIVDVGLGQLATWTANSFSVATGVNYGAIGIGTNTPAPADTQLQTEVQRQVPSSYNASGVIAYFSMYYPVGVLSSRTYYEYGWFINGTGTANSGELFSHFLLGTGIAVTGSTALVVESNFTYTG